MSLHHPLLDLVQRYADGQSTAEETARLERALRDDPSLRAAFREYMNIDSALESLAAASDAAALEKLIPMRRRSISRWAAIAALVAVLIGAWFLRPHPQPAAPGLPGLTAEVVEVTNAPEWRPGDLVPLQGVKVLPSGEITLRLRSGALVTFRGPADFEFLDEMQLQLGAGQVTVDVGEHAKGFTVITPQTRVVDLGTKFGVNVAEVDHTDVVVFQGEVDVFENPAPDARTALSRLTEGEAIRIDEQQRLTRIANITSGPRDEQWYTVGAIPKSVIASVRDNLRDPEAKNFYRIIPGGVEEDIRAFVGQRHEWNGLTPEGIPPWLRGADLVQTFMSDRLKSSLEVTVTLSRPAVLYVFFDDRKEHPAWLSENFTDTGAKIGLEYAAPPSAGRPVATGPGAGNLARLSVWKRVMPEAGSITLGPPHDPGETSTNWNWMYGIAAQPLQ